MSLHNRFLSLGLIVAAAKSVDGFPEFEKFMTKPAIYSYLDKESSPIHEIFLHNPEIRKDLWILIGTQQLRAGRASISLNGLCKAWFILKNPSNDESHKETIKTYLSLLERCEPQYKQILEEIVTVLNKK